MANTAENYPTPEDDDESTVMATMVCSIAIIGMLHDVCKFLENDGTEAFCEFMKTQPDYNPNYPAVRETVEKIVKGFHRTIDMAIHSGMGVFTL